MGRRQLVRITEPLAMDPLPPAVLGTVAWTAALVALLVVDLAPGHEWWRWAAATGAVVGLLGVLAARRARRQPVGAPSRAGSADAADAGSSPDPSSGRGSVSSS